MVENAEELAGADPLSALYNAIVGKKKPSLVIRTTK